ncbi:hypothetical protein KIN20_024127 [Parelaphostrongylus tenuis]|uniref:alpha-1,2-Mannosidase n=1 Tax=Parelaphostrongylus tenuis TaxID=148309 RepID=A0AAD5MXU5_PARTN|nr:hypothetical protein KIN20_024127 [Parelaphostrongylus tenuis]
MLQSSAYILLLYRVINFFDTACTENDKCAFMQFKRLMKIEFSHKRSPDNVLKAEFILKSVSCVNMKSANIFICSCMVLSVYCGVQSSWHPFIASPWQTKYSRFSRVDQLEALRDAREMFYFAYDSYMNFAYPADELDPIHCTGRGHDHNNPGNININDVLGDYSLTLIDSLDTLVVLGDHVEFKRAVSLIIDSVTFEKNTTVQVFEATIRVIGSLLSAHLIASDKSLLFGNFFIPEYDGELLTLAHDLAARLLPAFEGTKTGIPYPRVNLLNGVLEGTVEETCTSGAGSLLLEFGILSRLLGDQTYERTARRVNEKLWQLRDPNTGLPGNLINIQTGKWVGYLSGVGAGLDSYYEYFLKAYILFGEPRDLQLFNEAYVAILANMRRGRASCSAHDGEPPLFVNVDSRDGSIANTWIDSLQASFAGLLVLAGQLEEAICQHAFYYAVWSKYGVLPERFNWQFKRPDVSFYPLRPEFVESTYYLYRATKNPFYLNVGREILDSLNSKTRVKCGFATVHNVDDGSLEDRMESFFLAETMKYLYLLFDEDNPVNIHQERLLFTTEGHIIPVLHKFREHSYVEADDYNKEDTKKGYRCRSLCSKLLDTTKLGGVIKSKRKALEYYEKIHSVRRCLMRRFGLLYSSNFDSHVLPVFPVITSRRCFLRRIFRYCYSSSTSSSQPGNSSIVVRFERGLPLLNVPLPSRQEPCQFSLRPLTDNVRGFCEQLQQEDRGLDHVALYTKDGVRIAMSTSIEHLLLFGEFRLRLNDKFYDVTLPAVNFDDFLSNDKMRHIDDLRATVASLHSCLCVDEYKVGRERRLIQQLEKAESELRPLHEKKLQIERDCDGARRACDVGRICNDGNTNRYFRTIDMVGIFLGYYGTSYIFCHLFHSHGRFRILSVYAPAFRISQSSRTGYDQAIL